MTALIYDLDFPAMAEVFESWNEPAYRAQQLWDGLYRQLHASADDIPNLPKELRLKLRQHFRFEAFDVQRSQDSSDGSTRKTLFAMPDGRVIEAVLMRYGDPADVSAGARVAPKRRRTLCISTQAGCAMGCVFCATGQMGFGRHLSSGEIAAQALYYARMLREQGEVVTNIVLMGMGEPFHNYDNSLAAIDRLNDPRGFNLGARRFTISTVGLVPQIRRFANEHRQVNLAISLHSVSDEQRVSMLPVNKRYPIAELLDACRYYVAATKRRITFEWALIRGVNDTPAVALELAQRVKGLLCHVNAIPLNPTEGYKGAAASRARALLFKETLENAGIACTIRMRRGIDIQAGCGQLAAEHKRSAVGVS